MGKNRPTKNLTLEEQISQLYNLNIPSKYYEHLRKYLALLKEGDEKDALRIRIRILPKIHLQLLNRVTGGGIVLFDLSKQPEAFTVYEPQEEDEEDYTVVGVKVPGHRPPDDFLPLSIKQLSIEKIKDRMRQEGKYFKATEEKLNILEKKLGRLSTKTEQIYQGLRHELKLPYQPIQLVWEHNKHKEYDLLYKVRQLIHGIESLRKQKILILQAVEGEGKGGAKARAEEAETSQKADIFRKKGEKWEISYKGGERFYLDEHKGLHYIKHLLLNPGKWFNPLELVRLAEGMPIDKVIDDVQAYWEDQKDEEDKTGLSISSSLGRKQKLTDNVSVQNIRRAIEKLKEDIETAEENKDIEEVEELKKKKSALEKCLCSGGKSKYFTNEKERAYQAVYKAIGRSLEVISRHNQTLYKHLKDSIKSFSYNPQEPTSWV